MRSRVKFWTNPAAVFLVAFFCCLLWGSASPSIKIGYALFSIGAEDLASRFVFAGVRFMIAGGMVIAIGSMMERRFLRPTRESWRYVLVLMLFQTILQYIFFYTGLAHTSGVRGSVINAAGTFFSLFLAAYVFRFEKLTAARVVGSIAGFLGVLLIVTAGGTGGRGISFSGEGFMVIAALTGAFAGCFIKLFSARENPVTLSGWQFLSGGMVLTLMGLALGGRLRPTGGRAWLLLLYMGFISAGAYTLWGILLKYNEVSRITILGFMNPVLGVLLSALFLGEGREAFSVRVFAALVLVSAGIILSGKKAAVQIRGGGNAVLTAALFSMGGILLSMTLGGCGSERVGIAATGDTLSVSRIAGEESGTVPGTTAVGAAEWSSEGLTKDSLTEESGQAAAAPFDPEQDAWISKGESWQGGVGDTANKDGTLSVPTILKRIGDTWFLVDCYHDRILYHAGDEEALTDAISDWSVLPRNGVSRPHTVAGDGLVLLADDTENNRVLVYTKVGGVFTTTQVFRNIGRRPHFSVYDPDTDTFYVWSSENGELYCFRHPKDDPTLYLTEVKSCPALSNTYVRSFTIFGDRILFVSGTSTDGGQARILLCRLSDLSVQEAYPVCDAYAGMVRILPVIDSDEELPAEGEPHTQEVFGKIEEGAACRNGYFVTVSTDLTGDQSAAVMLWTPFLESLAAEPGTALSAGVRDIYSTYFIGGGTPYYMTRTDGRYYLMEHRLPGHAVWSFAVADGRITDVQDLY